VRTVRCNVSSNSSNIVGANIRVRRGQGACNLGLVMGQHVDIIEIYWALAISILWAARHFALKYMYEKLTIMSQIYAIFSEKVFFVDFFERGEMPPTSPRLLRL